MRRGVVITASITAHTRRSRKRGLRQPVVLAMRASHRAEDAASSLYHKRKGGKAGRLRQ